MDPSVAIILGVVIGAVLTWVITLFQREADKRAREIERKYERLHAASRLIRLSMIQAAQLNYSRTFIARFLDVTAWPQLRWATFARTLSEAGAALALVVDEVPNSVGAEYEAAAQALLDTGRADRQKLVRYVKAATALYQAADLRARALR